MRRLLLLGLLALVAAFATAQDTQSPFDIDMGTSTAPPGTTQAPVPAAPPAAPATVTVTPAPGSSAHAAAPPAFDYSANATSPAFGAQLFTGNFAREGAANFNPEYAIAIGDQIQVRFWGGFDYEALLTVDPKGNLFLPHVGPVMVLGVRNNDLQKVIEAAVARVFRANVYSYANLAAAQPVRVYVSGFVNRPGLYDGTSLDSLLHYLDLAGGVDAERGSYLDVQVKRAGAVRARVNLYDFLLEGRMSQVQLAEGDVVFVPARRNTVTVAGMAQNARRFEFNEQTLTLAQLARMSRPLASATHVRVTRNSGSLRNVEYYALEEAASVSLGNGDTLEYTADKKPGTITVRVEGEHQSAQEYVLPYGARLGELMQKVQFSERSDSDSLQLFRISVRERQKEMLDQALKSLEAAALTARSGTSDEARLRTDEAKLLLAWVDRARTIEPLGQVLIAGSGRRDELLLENGDVIRVPTRDGLVLVSGEVLFPNAIAFDGELVVGDYVQRAGGYTQNADASRVVIAHRDGSFEEGNHKDRMWGKDTPAPGVRSGDEILVLPKIDVKSRQIWKDMTQIIYQIAVSARVVASGL